MRISDWSSDVCSSDLPKTSRSRLERQKRGWTAPGNRSGFQRPPGGPGNRTPWTPLHDGVSGVRLGNRGRAIFEATPARSPTRPPIEYWRWVAGRSEEHTSELQSLMRISYAVFCLKKKNHKETT